MLVCENINKCFATEQEQHVVAKEVHLSVADGEFLSILGQSGCGKSTLLRMLGGFLRPDSGTVLLDGQTITKPSTDMLMVFQSFDQLFPWKTVEGNLLFALKKANPNLPKAQAKMRVEQCLAKMGLSEFARSFPYALSGGMKQRAALARALALRPKVLLMDEPFSSLDCFTRKEAQQILLQLWKETGVTVIFVTHDIDEAVMLSTQIAVYSKAQLGITEVVKVEGEKAAISAYLHRVLEGVRV